MATTVTMTFADRFDPLTARDAALAELRRAPERVYFDDEADAAASDAYYRDVEPTDVADLTALVAQTHRVPLAYGPAVQLYPWVDLQPDLSLTSLYTGERYDPAELIDRDIEVARQRREESRRITRSGAAPDERAEDLLESVLPYNCEHSVPQSWFGKKEPMRGDLHHLFACESRCNGFRANTPFMEFADFRRPSTGGAEPRVVRDKCGKSEGNGFEPHHGKGAVARAVLYFAVRYPGLMDEMPPARYPMLLTWHRQDPVSLWEKHRNAAISARQGNRNPFIDRPGWADEFLSQLSP
jgi:endonuclease G